METAGFKRKNWKIYQQHQAVQSLGHFLGYQPLVGASIRLRHMLELTGWWCNNHLEKYEFVNGKDYPIYEMENKTCLKPPTRGNMNNILEHTVTQWMKIGTMNLTGVKIVTSNLHHSAEKDPWTVASCQFFGNLSNLQRKPGLYHPTSCWENIYGSKINICERDKNSIRLAPLQV